MEIEILRKFKTSNNHFAASLAHVLINWVPNCEMHDATSRSFWLDLLERRDRCEVAVEQLVTACAQRDVVQTACAALVERIVEWRFASQEIALALSRAGNDAVDEAHRARAGQVNSLCAEVDQLGRLCFEVAGSDASVGAGAAAEDAALGRALRCFADGRRAGAAGQRRFSFVALVGLLAARATARTAAASETPDSARVEESRGTGLGGVSRDYDSERGAGNSDECTWTSFYDIDDDADESDAKDSELCADAEQQLFGAYWDAVEGAEFAFDDVAVRTARLQHGSRQDAPEPTGDVREEVREGSEACAKDSGARHAQEVRAQEGLATTTQRICFEYRRCAQPFGKPRPYRSVCQSTTARRSLAEFKTSGVRSPWLSESHAKSLWGVF